jgi:hypothetical protein
MGQQKNINVSFETTENTYIIKIDEKRIPLNRAEAVKLQNELTKKLKETPLLFTGS